MTSTKTKTTTEVVRQPMTAPELYEVQTRRNKQRGTGPVAVIEMNGHAIPVSIFERTDGWYKLETSTGFRSVHAATCRFNVLVIL